MITPEWAIPAVDRVQPLVIEATSQKDPPECGQKKAVVSSGGTAIEWKMLIPTYPLCAPWVTECQSAISTEKKDSVTLVTKAESKTGSPMTYQTWSKHDLNQQKFIHELRKPSATELRCFHVSSGSNWCQWENATCKNAYCTLGSIESKSIFCPPGPSYNPDTWSEALRWRARGYVLTFEGGALRASPPLRSARCVRSFTGTCFIGTRTHNINIDAYRII